MPTQAAEEHADKAWRIRYKLPMILSVMPDGVSLSARVEQ
jgi:hypothetical protein